MFSVQCAVFASGANFGVSSFTGTHLCCNGTVEIGMPTSTSTSTCWAGGADRETCSVWGVPLATWASSRQAKPPHLLPPLPA